MIHNKLFQNYIDDASFYYEQRKYLINKPNFFWRDLDKVENRLNKSIDGFFPEKNDKALEFCLSVIDSCELGELYAVISVIIRSNAHDKLFQIIDESGYFDNKETLEVLVDALKYKMPDKWIDSFIEKMYEDQNYVPLVIELCGYRRIGLEKDHVDFLLKNSNDKARMIWYLGRIKQFNAELLKYLNTEDPIIYSETAISILRSKNETLKEKLFKDLHTKEWAVIPKALTGSNEFDDEILKYFTKYKTEESILALALTGNPDYFNKLIKLLESDETKESGALALHSLTGAGITDEVFLYENIDEDILFEDEKKRLDEGNNPYLDGEEPREKATIISQNQDKWLNWWDENKSRFDKATRYRLGLTYSATPLIEMLKANLPAYIRRFAYEELSMHFGVDTTFETDIFVKDQIRAIEEMP